MSSKSSVKQFSRRQVLVLGGQTLFLSMVAGCTSTTPTPPVLPTKAVPTSTVGVPEPSKVPNPMSTTPSPPSIELEEKIGQMLMLGFRGMELQPDDPMVTNLRERNLGGVVLFSYDSELKKFERNIASYEQLKALNASLQDYARTPLIISVDQEGGLVTRLMEQFGFPATRSEQYYGTLNDPGATRAAAETEGKILRELGFNLNLAPVVDLNLNPNNPVIGKVERSFSADPKIVTAQATAEIEGYHAQELLCTLKHFPGHGSSTNDSHKGFVDVTQTWQPIELEPYRNLINAGLGDAVMTAHIFNSNLDPQYPATLSQKIITGILREQLHYDGVVISDDMQMGAIRQYYGFEQAVELAINAGVDILAIANNLIYESDIGARTVKIISQLVQDEKISPERIEQSYQRIQRLKARLQN